jgi:Conserved TM helix
MDQMNSIFQSLSSGLGPYAPRIIGALVIVIVTWAMARVLRSMVRRLGTAKQIDAWIKSPGITELLGEITYPTKGGPPALPGRQQQFDIYGSPSAKLRKVSRQSTREGVSRWTSTKA